MRVECTFRLRFGLAISTHLPSAAAATVNAKPRRQIKNGKQSLSKEVHGTDLTQNHLSRLLGSLPQCMFRATESNRMKSYSCRPSVRKSLKALQPLLCSFGH